MESLPHAQLRGGGYEATARNRSGEPESKDKRRRKKVLSGRVELGEPLPDHRREPEIILRKGFLTPPTRSGARNWIERVIRGVFEKLAVEADWYPDLVATLTRHPEIRTTRTAKYRWLLN